MKNTVLIKNATILPFTLQTDGSLDLEPQIADVLVEGDRISQITLNIESTSADAQVIDATDQLLIPGFVNAHAHSVEILEKGNHEASPLELWMLYTYPPLRSQHLDPRLCYLRTMIGALEMVKYGGTTIQDDLIELPYVTPETFDAVAQAYVDVGMRVSLSLHTINKLLHDTIPYLGDFLPPDVKHDLETTKILSDDEWVDLFQYAHQKWQGYQGLVTTVLAPSASQRVTPELMHRIASLSEEYDLPIHTHLLETKTQAITGLELYGESVVAYAKRHGILTHRTAIAHGIWLTPQDIELIADANATVIHNIVSNHRLCSGIAPIRELMDAGVNIALGSDGMSSNDSFNLFDVIKAAGLVHSAMDNPYDRYPKAADVLKWATYGGARSALLHKDVGAIAPGMKADFVLYDLNTLSFTPRHQLPIHLVYAENGSSIRKVFINGQLVVENGRVLTVNEADVLAEFHERMPEYASYRKEIWQQAERIHPAIEKTLSTALNQPFSVNRFSRPQYAS
ncbi:amidohydrolase [Oculatella sp. FACHB-28]|uniref:amidohydrolase family protein n=1 Tax=Oculatella sp. FACHB-28 TaxID=2692845 RepID=UPI0016838D4C|nr:amidohydrolase [Oculatella sp. FACHB-28]